MNNKKYQMTQQNDRIFIGNDALDLSMNPEQDSQQFWLRLKEQKPPKKLNIVQQRISQQIHKTIQCLSIKNGQKLLKVMNPFNNSTKNQLSNDRQVLSNNFTKKFNQDEIDKYLSFDTGVELSSQSNKDLGLNF